MARTCWHALLALGALILVGGPLAAGDIYPDKSPATADSTPLPKPAEVRALVVHPQQITLKGADDAQQLILTATLADGRQQDLTGDVKYEAADAKVVRVTTGGRIIPIANGRTEVTAAYGDTVVRVPVTAESCDV